MHKVLHIISGLGQGGAETMLLKLLQNFDRSIVYSKVICLTNKTEMLQAYKDIGIEVKVINIKNPFNIIRVMHEIRATKPDLIQTWLHHADLIGLILGPLSGCKKIIWNIRCSELTVQTNGMFNMALIKLLAMLAKFPKLVIANSYAGINAHRQYGYNPPHWEMVPNGFDTETFYKDFSSRSSLRKELGLPDECLIIGWVGRNDPIKGINDFFKVAKSVAQKRSDVFFIMAGNGLDTSNKLLAKKASELNIDHRLIFLGPRPNISNLLSGFDIFLSSSLSEGFPNTLGEAMACEVPCIATDVGDCREILNENKNIFKVGDIEEIANRCIDLLNLSDIEKAALGKKSRKRIKDHFSIEKVCDRYQSIYTQL